MKCVLYFLGAVLLSGCAYINGLYQDVDDSVSQGSIAKLARGMLVSKGKALGGWVRLLEKRAFEERVVARLKLYRKPESYQEEGWIMEP